MAASEQNFRARKRLSRELLLGGLAVAGLAIALAHPAVMSIAGLDFAHQRAIGPLDPLAVGSIARARNVHGLAGVLKPMRLRD